MEILRDNYDTGELPETIYSDSKFMIYKTTSNSLPYMLTLLNDYRYDSHIFLSNDLNIMYDYIKKHEVEQLTLF